MRIAVLTPTFYRYSGIDRVVELQVRELSKKHEVTVYCFEGDIAVPNVALRRIGMPKNPTLSRIYRLMLFALPCCNRRRVRKELVRFDELRVHFYPMSVLASDAKRDNPKLRVIEHDYGVATPELFEHVHERLYLRLFKRLSYKYMKRADAVIAISNYLADVLKREANIDASVEHIKIDTRRFHKGISGARVRTKLGIGKAPMCLYVGRLSPHKGVHLLLEAYKIAKRQIPDLTLVIGGKATFPAYEQRLRSLADKDVIFAGFISDEELPEYYAAATLYTTATRWEGFDMPIPEAAACGTPTVAFDVCSHPEVTKNGTLVTDGDVQAFARAMIARLQARPKAARTRRVSSSKGSSSRGSSSTSRARRR